jgi:hypothetical protein
MGSYTVDELNAIADEVEAEVEDIFDSHKPHSVVAFTIVETVALNVALDAKARGQDSGKLLEDFFTEVTLSVENILSLISPEELTAILAAAQLEHSSPVDGGEYGDN